jgi:hypothetical protein
MPKIAPRPCVTELAISSPVVWGRDFLLGVNPDLRTDPAGSPSAAGWTVEGLEGEDSDADALSVSGTEEVMAAS